MKSLIHSQTSIPSRTYCDYDYLFMLEFKDNPCHLKGPDRVGVSRTSDNLLNAPEVHYIDK